MSVYALVFVSFFHLHSQHGSYCLENTFVMYKYVFSVCVCGCECVRVFFCAGQSRAKWIPSILIELEPRG